MWFLLSLFSAGFETVRDTFGKVSATKTNEVTSTFALHLVNFLIFIPVVFFSGIPDLKTSFWLGSAGFLIITPLWSYFYMYALKNSELSVVLPMMAFNPIFTAILAYPFKETITATGWLGVSLIGVGIYFVNFSKLNKDDLLYPVKQIYQNKAAQAMLAVALLWSIGAYLSKMRVTGSSPVFSTFTSGLIGVITTYAITIIKKQRIDYSAIKNNLTTFTPVGLFYVLANYSSSVALQTGPAAYIFSIKRSSIIFGSLVGKFYFGEKLSYTKLAGLLLILTGVFFLAF